MTNANGRLGQQVDDRSWTTLLCGRGDAVPSPYAIMSLSGLPYRQLPTLERRVESLRVRKNDRARWPPVRSDLPHADNGRWAMRIGAVR
jgi:hypothetical protein